MTSRDPGPPPTWRIVVAFGVVIALAGALFLESGGDAETVTAGTGPVSGSTTSVAADTTDPSTTVAPIDPVDRLIADTERALVAWGVFAATGELAAVAATFADGPQLAQLRSEAVGLSESAPGLPAFEFDMTQAEIRNVSADAAVVRSSIRMTRPDTEPAAFDWDIEMRWDESGGRWRLWTVSTVDG